MCIPWSLPAFPLTTRHPDWCLLDVLEPKIAPPSTPSKFQPQFNLPVTSKQHQNSRSLPLLQASPRVYRFSFPCFYFYLWSISSCLAFGTPLGSATTDMFCRILRERGTEAVVLQPSGFRRSCCVRACMKMHDGQVGTIRFGLCTAIVDSLLPL